MLRKSLYNNFVKFVNANVGKMIDRDDMLRACYPTESDYKYAKKYRSTVDQYRLYATRCMYLSVVSPGRWQVNRRIPATLSSSDLAKQCRTIR